MKKLKMIGAIGGALSLVLCWPMAVGQMGQKALTHTIQNLHSDRIAVSIEKYDRGYLTSEVMLHVNVMEPQWRQHLADTGLPTEFEIASQLHHGVFSVRAHSVMQSTVELPLDVDSNTYLTGKTDFVAKLGSWLWESPSNSTHRIQSEASMLSGEVTAKSGLTHYKIHVPKLLLALGELGNLDVEQLQGTGNDLHQGWWGNHHLSVEHVDVQQAQTRLTLQQAEYRSQWLSNDQRVTHRHHVQASQWTLNDQSAKNIDIDIALNDADREAALALLPYLTHPNVTHRQVPASLAAQVDALFEKGFSVSLTRTAMSLKEGAFDIHGEWQIPQQVQHASQNLLGAVIFQSQGNIHADIASSIISAYPELLKLNQFAPKAIQETNHGYTLDADFQQGQVIFAEQAPISLLLALSPFVIQPPSLPQ